MKNFLTVVLTSMMGLLTVVVLLTLITKANAATVPLLDGVAVELYVEPDYTAFNTCVDEEIAANDKKGWLIVASVFVGWVIDLPLAAGVSLSMDSAKMDCYKLLKQQQEK